MNTAIYHKNGHLPQINQEEVNKFYQEREFSKKRFNPLSSLPLRNQNLQNESSNHAAFNNLYRRKSLMQKLKQDESMFTSFNNSVEVDNSLSQSQLRKSTHRTEYENTLNEEQIFKNNPNEQKPQFLHSNLQNHGKSLNNSWSSESFASRLKKRSNSVQLQSTPASFYGIRQQKGTIPLSTILKKYQEEVSKLQQENLRNLNNSMQFSKVQQPKKEINSKAGQNKENYETFNPSSHFEKQQTEPNQKSSNRLPEVLQKCIDKWRDLQIEHLRAERLYNKRKEVQKKDDNLCTMTEQKSQQPCNAGRQTKDQKQVEKKKAEQTKQYERILKQKEECIKQLEKQNSQYKKFVQSIQKMKNTLENFQAQKQKHPVTAKTSNQPQKNTPTNPNESETNLKDLWRWIKSLPTKKSQQTKNQHLR